MKFSGRNAFPDTNVYPFTGIKPFPDGLLIDKYNPVADRHWKYPSEHCTDFVFGLARRGPASGFL